MTQKKPIIGITPSHNTENNDTSLRPTYPKAIAAAGGLPILLPLECSDEDIKQFVTVFFLQEDRTLIHFFLGKIPI